MKFTIKYSLFFSIAATSLFANLGCQRYASFESIHWKSGSAATETPPQPSLKSATKPQSVSLNGFRAMLQYQKVNGAEVLGSYAKIVDDKEQRLRVDSLWLENPSTELKADALLMGQLSKLFLNTLKFQHPEIRNWRLEGSHLIVNPSGGDSNKRPQIEWEFTFLNEQQKLQSFRINKYYVSRGFLTSYSCFYESQAELYPMGPLKSNLSIVTLDKLISSHSLTSETVKLAPLNPSIASPENNKYEYPQDDPRFFQLHAYHYVEQSYRWFEAHLNFKMPEQISLETSVGYPEKTNTAFYFRKIIRLGDGDDIVFSKIPMDPSISVHESIHAIIDVVAHLPYEGEGGSLNEGFSDFFATHILDNPNLGEVSYKKAPFKRTVQNSKKYQELAGGLYADSGILSGLLWQIRTDLGREAAQEIAWKLLVMCHPETQFKDVRENIKYLASSLPVESAQKIQIILKERGWIE